MKMSRLGFSEKLVPELPLRTRGKRKVTNEISNSAACSFFLPGGRAAKGRKATRNA